MMFMMVVVIVVTMVMAFTSTPSTMKSEVLFRIGVTGKPHMQKIP